MPLHEKSSAQVAALIVRQQVARTINLSRGRDGSGASATTRIAMRTGKKVLSYPIAQPEQVGDIASAAAKKAQRVWRVWLAIVLAARYKH